LLREERRFKSIAQRCDAEILLARLFRDRFIIVDHRMKTLPDTKPPLGWVLSFFFMLLAVICFHLAYTPLQHPLFGLFIFGYALCLTQLAHQRTVRRAFYFGLTAGFLCVAPQLTCFWEIFKAGAVPLWLLLSFWIGLFTTIVCACFKRWGRMRAMWLVPFIWTGLEYFRSELYYLKFSWLNAGYVFPEIPFFHINVLGMYFAGLFLFLLATIYCHRPLLTKFQLEIIPILVVLLVVIVILLRLNHAVNFKGNSLPIGLVGVQMEFPAANAIPKALDNALAKHPGTEIFVLSEYTLLGPVPDSLKDWSRKNSRYLVVGAEDPIPAKSNYFDTAFVIGTNGDIIFKQAKCVPIQFFKDGLPAEKQELWNSPWGKIGFCICYDLSYTRITDELVRQGAQLLIVPTMDVEDWGKHEHEIHALVAPVRAAEYGIPIFRVASSGVSQAVSGNGDVIAKTSVPGSGEIISAKLYLPKKGSLPLDRWLAPFCVVVTGAVLILLIVLALRDNRLERKTIS
jgi:apolipoprotein N-acyltransferase